MSAIKLLTVQNLFIMCSAQFWIQIIVTQLFGNQSKSAWEYCLKTFSWKGYLPFLIKCNMFLEFITLLFGAISSWKGYLPFLIKYKMFLEFITLLFGTIKSSLPCGFKIILWSPYECSYLYFTALDDFQPQIVACIWDYVFKDDVIEDDEELW